MKLAGYLINTSSGLQGLRGSAYEYTMAGNGIFITAVGQHIGARIQVSSGVVRGLPALTPKVVMQHGRIPANLIETIVWQFTRNPEKEMFMAVIWSGFNDYRLVYPKQRRTASSVKYVPVENTVLEIHSHGRGPARFSSVDDQDECGLKLYGVVGPCDQKPEILIRIGVYGYFYHVPFSSIVNGEITSATEAVISQKITTGDKG